MGVKTDSCKVLGITQLLDVQEENGGVEGRGGLISEGGSLLALLGLSFRSLSLLVLKFCWSLFGGGGWELLLLRF